MNILFVCTGNACRSPMAAAYFDELCRRRGLENIEVDSAGLRAGGWPVSEEANSLLLERGIMPLRATSQAVSEPLLEWADLVITMTRAHQIEIETEYPGEIVKTRPLLSWLGEDRDVDDPMGQPRQAYEACLADMIPALNALADWIEDRRQTVS